MSAAPQPEPRWTAEAYLAFERASETKHEFIHGEVIAMAGASVNHLLITRNLYSQLARKLQGGPCDYFHSDTSVRIQATDSYVYPDVSIVCGDAQLEDHGIGVLINPTVLIEVLSPSNMDYDLGKKWLLYQMLPTLRECLFVHQDRALIHHHTRQSEDQWLTTNLRGRETVLTLEAVGAHLSLSDIYERVTFDRVTFDEEA